MDILDMSQAIAIFEGELFFKVLRYLVAALFRDSITLV